MFPLQMRFIDVDHSACQYQDTDGRRNNRIDSLHKEDVDTLVLHDILDEVCTWSP